MSESSKRFIREPEVRAKTGKSHTAIWRDVKTGIFPSPYRIGARAVAWLESDVENWMSRTTSTPWKPSPLTKKAAGHRKKTTVAA